MLLLVPFPPFAGALLRPALYHGLEDLCHPIAFALLAYLASRAMLDFGIAMRPLPIALLFVGLACLGAASEWLQQYTGRDASVSDFIGDVLGTWTGIALFCRRRIAGSPRRQWMLSAVATMLAAAAPFGWTLTAYVWRSAVSPVMWQADSRLLDYFAEHQRGAYPGIALTEVPPNWQPYSTLIVVVRNPHDSNSSFEVLANDAGHGNSYGDRYNAEFEIPARSTVSYRISLRKLVSAPMPRSMNLQSMARVIVYQLRERNQPAIEILQIALSS